MPGAVAAAMALLVGPAALVACGSGSDTVEASPHPDVSAPRVAVVSVTGVTGLPPYAQARAQAQALPRSHAPYLAGMPPTARAESEKAIAGLAVRKGETLYAQVVHVGCQEAGEDTVSVGRRGDAVVMSSDFQEPEDTECFAPVSSVAFAAVPD